MYKIFKGPNGLAYDIRKFICDTVDDIETIPEAGFGDTVFVIEDKDHYILNSNHEWCCITSDRDKIVSELTIWKDL